MRTVIAFLSFAIFVIPTRADVLVASRDTQSVLAYNETSGAFLRSFTSGGDLEQPESMVFGPDGNLYTCDRMTDSILVFNGKTGAFMRTFVQGGTGGLTGPRNLSFSPDGVLFVSSNATDAVLVFNGTTGAFQKTFFQLGGFLPRGIAFRRGEVFVASEGRNQIVHYSAAGDSLGVFASDPALQSPREIVFGPDGNLYVSSSANNVVLRFNGTTGAFMGVFASAGLIFPRGLVFTPDGSLLVVSANTGSVLRFTSTGAAAGTFTQGGVLSFPTGIAYTPSAAAGTPTFTAAGVANAASYASGLSPGSLAVLFGTNLSAASGVVAAPGLPWPVQLAQASVRIGTTAAPIFAVAKVNGQEQIDFQVPLELAGQTSATVVVTNNGLSSAPITVSLLPVQPGLFSFDGVNASALHGVTNTLISPASPAARGETVVLYLTGMGAVNPAAATNVPASATTLAFTNATPTVTFGGITAAVPFSGLAPTYIGLYQINVVVPQNAPTGSVDVIVSANGVSSKSVKIFLN